MATAIDLLPRQLYPQRAEVEESWADRLFAAAQGRAARTWRRTRGSGLDRILALVALHEATVAGLSEDTFAAAVTGVRTDLRRQGLSEPLIGRAFALVRETATRVLGQRHHDVQLMGGFALTRGMLAEMQTGEGKTLTATLAAATAALAGLHVHVITVNDYLANRDAELMAPVYRALGLSVAVAGERVDPEMRRQAYRADVTYVTNKQIAFDHLRDRMLLRGNGSDVRLKAGRLYQGHPLDSRLLLRGLQFAIVDEADSILIDEARTPLIISGEGRPGAEARIAESALALAQRLSVGQDYRILEQERRIELTDAGRERVADLARDFGGVWTGAVRREEFALQALSALHLFHRDEHYLVREGRIAIIDEYTGRVMADRYWGQGLHQMVEAKEGVTFSGHKTTLAQLTYQRFFRRYHRLSGMTGTAREVANEIWDVYRLPSVTIPTHRPVQRRMLTPRLFSSEPEKWAAAAARAQEIAHAGRPVLIGTRTVAASDQAAAALTALGIPHQVLNATQDRDEASIVAAAGAEGKITVATNMAGRGTDIKLSDAARAAGGLHVMICELNDAHRVDRQLAGRSGRQGDPGSYEFFLSLDDRILTGAVAKGLAAVAARLLMVNPKIGTRLGQFALAAAQVRLERIHARIRKLQLDLDRRRRRSLAFSGEQD